jgi:hypothetical protein
MRRRLGRDGAHAVTEQSERGQERRPRPQRSGSTAAPRGLQNARSTVYAAVAWGCVPTILPVWLVTLAAAIAVGVLAGRAYLTWLPVVAARVTILTFAIQLMLQRKEETVTRMSLDRRRPRRSCSSRPACWPCCIRRSPLRLARLGGMMLALELFFIGLLGSRRSPSDSSRCRAVQPVPRPALRQALSSMFDFDAGLPAEIVPLSWLLGVWEGTGC